MPEISWPPFQIEYHNKTLSFPEVCAELGSGIVVVPLVAVLANVAIAKAFSKFSSQRNQCVILFTLTFPCPYYSKRNDSRCIPRNVNIGFV